MSDEDRQKLTEYCKNKFYSMIKKNKQNRKNKYIK